MAISKTDIQDFDFIWDKWIVPLIYKIPDQMDVSFKERCNFDIRDLNSIKEKSREYFIEKRNLVKKEYYGDYPSTALEKHLMDFHKLSAVLCRTMIENKVYSFDTQVCIEYIKNEQINSKNTDWLIHNALVNFRLAFYVSIVFLYQSMLFQLKSYDNNLYEKLKEQKKLNLYTSINCRKVHESFENSLVLDLARRDINNHSFDSFLYSTIMYQLEEYNIMLLRQVEKQ